LVITLTVMTILTLGVLPLISDCTIFGVDNPDRYPPDLQTLVNGVNVVPRPSLITGGGPSGPNATDINSVATKKKVYLRGMPIDPITGKADWVLRSSYRAVDATSWGGENVFDIHSGRKSQGVEWREIQ
jgi:general secretion pathway protein G